MLFKDSDGEILNVVGLVSFAQVLEVLLEGISAVSRMGAHGVVLENYRNEVSRFLQTCQGNENNIYWYDGPWGMLSGSAGYCIVRDGVVVAAYPVKQA